MSAHRHQQGITFIGFLIVAAVVMFFAVLAMRLFPLYSEKFAVIQSMKSVASRPDIGNATDYDIQKALMSNFVIQDVNRFDKQTLPDYLTIEKNEQGGKNMTMEYEIRNVLYGELDVVLNFKYMVVLPVRG
jgi:Tfp pilus assembly protein PilE